MVSVGTDDRVEMGGTEASLGHKQKAATASGECSWAAARQWRRGGGTKCRVESGRRKHRYRARLNKSAAAALKFKSKTRRGL